MIAFSVGLAVIMVPLLLQCIGSLVSTESARHGYVCMPKVFAVLAIVGWCVTIGTTLASLILNGNDFCILASIVASVISLLCSVTYCSLRITYDGQGFWVKKFFGKAKYHTYDEICAITPGNQDATLRLKNANVFLDGLAVGRQEFLDYAEERYCAISGAFCIPDCPHWLFGGNVNDPWSIVIPVGMAWLFVFVAVLWLVCSGVHDICLIPDTLTYDDIYVTSAVLEDGAIYMNTQNSRFVLSGDKLISESRISEMVPGMLSVGYAAESGNGSDDLYEVWAITDSNGNDILRYETTKEYVVKGTGKSIAILVSFFTVFTALLGLGYYVLCYPERYRIIANMLIKKEQRNW